MSKRNEKTLTSHFALIEVYLFMDEYISGLCRFGKPQSTIKRKRKER